MILSNDTVKQLLECLSSGDPNFDIVIHSL